MATTTIQLSTKTKHRLAALKSHPRESFEEVMDKLLYLVPQGDDEGDYSNEFRAGLLDSLYEARKGKFFSLKQIERDSKRA
ncbi:MAG: hypothetical protein V1847_00290 [Candidatus Diapherotrites archaeon]